MRWFSRLLCLLGQHGPARLGFESQTRSARTNPFERTCSVCGAKWRGQEVVLRNVRTVGGWRRVK